LRREFVRMIVTSTKTHLPLKTDSAGSSVRRDEDRWFHWCRFGVEDGPPRRVGFIVDGAPARRKFPLSLCFMRILRWVDRNFGEEYHYGYVENAWHNKGTEVEIEVRNKLRKAVVTPMPFVKPKYWRG